MSYLPPLTDEDVFTFINKKYCDVIIPYLFSNVVTWGCNKSPSESFHDFIQAKKSQTEWNKFFRSLNKDDQLKLNLKSCDEFDVTFLYKLIPEVCSNVDRHGLSSWSSNDERKIECLLRKLKDTRNRVMHEPKGGATAKSIQSEVMRIGEKLIDSAGHLFSNPSQPSFQLDDEKVKFRRIAEEINNAVLPEKEKRLLQIKRKILTDCIEEVRAKQIARHGEACSFFSKTQSFYPVKLSPEDKEGSISFPCTSLLTSLRSSNPSNNVIWVIKGESGMGKTTILRNIEKDFYQHQSPKLFSELSQFELVFSVSCRIHTIKSLIDLVKESFGETAYKIEDEDLKQALGLVKILFLIDGIDEWNSSSRNLVEDIVLFSWNHPTAKCLVTSRPYATEVFTTFLDGERIQHQSLKIETLDSVSDQTNFLHLISGNSKVVSDMYDKLSLNLEYPAHLTLFNYFCSHDSNRLQYWDNESHMMRDTIDYCRSRALERMRQHRITNADLILEKIFIMICRTSFECLMKDRLHIEDSTYKEIRKECLEKFGAATDYDEIFSCFLTSMTSKEKNECRISYEFYHKSYQESLAGFHLYKIMETHDEEASTVLHDELMKTCNDDGTESETCKNFLRRNMGLLKSTAREVLDAGMADCDVNKLKSVLSEAEIQLSDAQSLINFCNNDETMSKVVAEAMTDEECWVVDSDRLIYPTCMLMAFRQPRCLKIHFPNATPEKALLELGSRINSHFKGRLELLLKQSQKAMLPCDAFLKNLEGSSCRLVKFIGCVGGEDSVKILSSISDQNTSFCISATKPDECSLQELENHFGELNVSINFSDVIPGNIAHVLPDSSNPVVLKAIIHNIPENGRLPTLESIKNLAKDSKWKFCLNLQHCKLSERDLSRLIEDLDLEGIMCTSGSTEKLWSNPGYYKHFGTCMCRLCHLSKIEHESVGLCFTIELRNINQIKSAADSFLGNKVKKDELVTLLCKSPITAKEGLEIIHFCGNHPQIAKIVSKVVFQEEKWVINNARELQATALLLQHKQPQDLFVHLQSFPPLREMVELSKSIKKHYKGDLRVVLPIALVPSSVCDEFLVKLKGSRCEVTRFHGCVQDKAAVLALSSISIPSSVFKIGFLDPGNHSLHLLNNHHLLDVHVRFDADFPDEDLSNPESRRRIAGLQRLNIEGIPENGRKKVSQIVKFLTGVSNRTFTLFLQHCKLTEPELNALMADLNASHSTSGPPQTNLWNKWFRVEYCIKNSCNTCRHCKIPEEEHTFLGPCVYFPPSL